jgi:hypothetical protein
MQGVYLLHFSQPFKHAKHYCGWARDIKRRITHHQAVRCVKLTAVVVESGIELLAVRVWIGCNLGEERRLKNYGGLGELCPLCVAVRHKTRVGSHQWLWPCFPGRGMRLRVKCRLCAFLGGVAGRAWSVRYAQFGLLSNATPTKRSLTWRSILRGCCWQIGLIEDAFLKRKDSGNVLKGDELQLSMGQPGSDC